MKIFDPTASKIKLWLIVFAASLLCVSGTRAEEAVVTLQDIGHRAYRLEGHMTVDAPVETVWKVLTDYSGIPRFVPSMRKSRVKENHLGHILLEQEGVGKALFFSRRVHVLLRVTEKPMTQIDFEDIDHRDFRHHRGSWQISENVARTALVYRLECQPRFFIPSFIGDRVWK